jgi:hypothetical protein
MKENKTSIKVGEKSLNFLRRIRVNRIKADMDLNRKKPLSYDEMLMIMEKYFKENNDSYLGLIKTLGEQNV